MVGASKGVKKEMHTGYWSGNLKEKNGLEDWAQLERISIDFKAKKVERHELEPFVQDKKSEHANE